MTPDTSQGVTQASVKEQWLKRLPAGPSEAQGSSQVGGWGSPHCPLGPRHTLPAPWKEEAFLPGFTGSQTNVFPQ